MGTYMRTLGLLKTPITNLNLCRFTSPFYSHPNGSNMFSLIKLLCCSFLTSFQYLLGNRKYVYVYVNNADILQNVSAAIIVSFAAILQCLLMICPQVLLNIRIKAKDVVDFSTIITKMSCRKCDKC